MPTTLPANNSMATLNALQQQIGSADFSNWQSLRKRFYSFLTYPSAGQSVLNFFGTALGQNGVQPEQTNMPKAASFGQQFFQLKAIACVVKINTWNLLAWTGTDATSLFADFVAGFVQAGVLDFFINSRPFAQIVKPFLYAPPFDGREMVYTAGLTTLTLANGTPNTLSTLVTAPPYATQSTERDGVYLVDPNIFIEAEQQFTVSISFPTGVVPVLGTSIVNDTSNPLQIGVILDGIVFRPLQ